MRRIVGMLLAVAGAFLLVSGLLLKFVAPGELEKTPTDVKSTTRLSGQAEKLNPKTGKLESFPVQITSVTLGNADKSDDEVVVWVNSVCVVKDQGNPPDCVSADDPQGRLVNASVDNFATDRVTALAVNDVKYLPADAEPHHGLVNKWPFNAERKSYPYWDGLVKRAVPAEFGGVEKLRGLETYRYDVAVPRTKTEVAKGIKGYYTASKSIWVEPKTGAIVDQEQHETRTLTNGDKIFELQASFIDKQVETGVKDAKTNAETLTNLTGPYALIAIIAGAVLSILGVVLIMVSRRRRPEDV